MIAPAVNAASLSTSSVALAVMKATSLPFPVENAAARARYVACSESIDDLLITASRFNLMSFAYSGRFSLS